MFENAGEGLDTVYSTAHFRLAANVDYLVLQGSADLQGYGNSLSNVLYGNTGNKSSTATPAPNDVRRRRQRRLFVDNAGDL